MSSSTPYTGYPKAKPTGRTYKPGDFPVKTYNSISGREVRIRYGDKRFDASLSLQYQNISDTSANEFLAHYDRQYGTYKSFTVPTEVTTGWSGSNYIPDTQAMKFRYKRAPSIVSVRPGVSNVSIELVGVI